MTLDPDGGDSIASASEPVDLGVLPSSLDDGIASRAAIGLVVLATDQTMEHEFRALVRQPGVAFYESRVFSDNDITPETLRAIGPRIAPSVASISCTSARGGRWMPLFQTFRFALVARPPYAWG